MDTLSRKVVQKRLERALAVMVIVGMVAFGAPGVQAAALPVAPGSRLSAAQELVPSAGDAQIAPSGESASVPLEGMVLLRNEELRYDLWRPVGWTISGVGNALVLTPDGQNSGTHFAIRATDTGDLVTGDNLRSHIDRLTELVHAAPNVQVVWQTRWMAGNATGFEARYTYYEDAIGIEYTHWLRLLHVGTWQYALDAEAPSGAEFERLQLAFAAMMLTFWPDDRLPAYAADM